MLLAVKNRQNICAPLSVLSLLGATLVAGAIPEPVRFPTTLTNIAQLRGLPLEIVKREIPVKLRATATAFSPSSIFLQDDTGGTYINLSVNPLPSTLAPGDILEVEGVSYHGRFLAGIRFARFRVVGRGDLPPPIPVSYDDLLSARRHYERVEIRGIVRSVTRSQSSERFILNVAMGTRKLEVQVVAPGVTNLPPLVDAQVRIAGLAAGYINNRRQLIAPQLLVNRLSDLRVETPPAEDPFAAPLTDARSLLNFHPDGISNHRVRVRGVVTHRQPGGALFLRDGEYGLMVQTPQTKTASPGDLVEAIGFPAMGRFSAFLDDAEFRVVGRQPAPEPLFTTVQEALTGTNDANLVTMTAQLLEVLDNPTESVLVLRADNTAFRARLPRTAVDLRNGSDVRLVGVCRVEEPNLSGSSFGANPRSIELLLRSPADVQLLTAPSRWTAQRLAIAAAILLGLSLVAFIWIFMLRRRVTEQAEVIRAKVRREAALEERHRMAREIHDTLAQSFSGLGFQLEALHARLPPNVSEAQTQLDIARQMVRHGQEGFRRSLMNLRAQELERGSLTEALPELARQITAGTGIELNCDVQRPPRGLPEVVEANLLRIGQECLANAVRHGHPRHIQLALTHTDSSVQLRISDDGNGFDSAQLQRAPNGHFGWRGIRERAEQIGAIVDLRTQPGTGTEVTVTVAA